MWIILWISSGYYDIPGVFGIDYEKIYETDVF